MLESLDTFFGVNAKQVKQRTDICNNCEYKEKVLKIPRCVKCGCVIPLKVKISKAKCPEGKW